MSGVRRLATVIVTTAVMFGAVDIFAESAEQRCRQVAAVAAAEVEADSEEILSAAAMDAVRDAALRGCLASAEPRPAASEAPTTAVRADVSGATAGSGSRGEAESDRGGFFDLFTGEVKRTPGNKRLQQRGKR